MALLNPTIYETRQRESSVHAIAALGIIPLCCLLILLELVLKWKFCFESWSVIMTSTFLVELPKRVPSHSSLNLMSQCWLFLYRGIHLVMAPVGYKAAEDGIAA